MTAVQLELALELALGLDDDEGQDHEDEVRLVARFDLAPAITAAGSIRTLAAICSAPFATVDQWRRRGVSWERADAIAVALGVHPGALWPTWWAAA